MRFVLTLLLVLFAGQAVAVEYAMRFRDNGQGVVPRLQKEEPRTEEYHPDTAPKFSIEGIGGDDEQSVLEPVPAEPLPAIPDDVLVDLLIQAVRFGESEALTNLLAIAILIFVLRNRPGSVKKTVEQFLEARAAVSRVDTPPTNKDT